MNLEIVQPCVVLADQTATFSDPSSASQPSRPPNRHKVVVDRHYVSISLPTHLLLWLMGHATRGSSSSASSPSITTRTPPTGSTLSCLAGGSGEAGFWGAARASPRRPQLTHPELPALSRRPIAALSPSTHLTPYRRPHPAPYPKRHRRTSRQTSVSAVPSMAPLPPHHPVSCAPSARRRW